MPDHVWHFLKSSSRALPLDTQFLAYNSPKIVWWPGSIRTRWWGLSSPELTENNSHSAEYIFLYILFRIYYFIVFYAFY